MAAIVCWEGVLAIKFLFLEMVSSGVTLAKISASSQLTSALCASVLGLWTRASSLDGKYGWTR